MATRRRGRPLEPETERDAYALMTRVLAEIAAVVPDAVLVPMDPAAIQRLLRAYPQAPRVRDVAFTLAYEQLPDRQQTLVADYIASRLHLTSNATPAQIMAAIRSRANEPRGAARATSLSSYVERELKNVLDHADRHTTVLRRAAGALLSRWHEIRAGYYRYLRAWRAEGMRVTAEATHDAEANSVEHPALRVVLGDKPAALCDDPGCTPVPHHHCARCNAVVVAIGGATHVDRGGGRFRSVGPLCDRCARGAPPNADTTR